MCQREFTLRLKGAGGQRGGHACQNTGVGEGCQRGSLHDRTGCLSASGVASMNRPLLTRQIRLCGISCCFYLKLFKLEVFSVSCHQHDIIPSPVPAELCSRLAGTLQIRYLRQPQCALGQSSPASSSVCPHLALETCLAGNKSLFVVHILDQVRWRTRGACSNAVRMFAEATCLR